MVSNTPVHCSISLCMKLHKCTHVIALVAHSSNQRPPLGNCGKKIMLMQYRQLAESLWVKNGSRFLRKRSYFLIPKTGQLTWKSCHRSNVSFSIDWETVANGRWRQQRISLYVKWSRKWYGATFTDRQKPANTWLGSTRTTRVKHGSSIAQYCIIPALKFPAHNRIQYWRVPMTSRFTRSLTWLGHPFHIQWRIYTQDYQGLCPGKLACSLVAS